MPTVDIDRSLIIQIIVAVLAISGIVWAYPKLPAPWNLVLVVLVAVVSVVVLLGLAGVF